MPGKNKEPLLGWHPPAELSAWVRSEAERTDTRISDVLNEALTVYRAFCNAVADTGRAWPEELQRNLSREDS